MGSINAIILAAGKGTRMKSDLPKVIHTINGKALAEYVIDAVKEAGIDDICLVVGYKADQVKENIHRQVDYALQEEQLGTGHAVMCASQFLDGHDSTLVLCGDTPLVSGTTLKALTNYHVKNGNSVTALSAIVENPTGYGRIVRNEAGEFICNVEHKDANEEELKINEINSGMYIFDSKELKLGLSEITTDNAQGEYYLPDVISVIRNKGLKVGAYAINDESEILGINTPEQLAVATEIINKRQA